MLEAYKSSLSAKQRKLIVENLSTGQCKFVLDAIANAQNLNLKLSPAQVKRLTRYKGLIKNVFTSPNYTRAQKIALLKKLSCNDVKQQQGNNKNKRQAGGFVGTLLGILANALPPILNYYLSSKQQQQQQQQ